MRESKTKVTDKLVRRLAEGGYGAPIIVPVIAEPDGTERNCFTNVEAVIRAKGGSAVTGRAVWSQVDGLWLNLQAHCIWQTPEGKLVDVSPYEVPMTEIVFIHEVIPFAGRLCPSKFIPLSKSKDVKRLLELRSKRELSELNHPAGSVFKMTPEEVQNASEQKMLLRKLNLPDG